MAGRGTAWADWVEGLPAAVRELSTRWEVTSDGTPKHGNCSLVVPVRTAAGDAAVLKIGFPEPDSEHEHLALRRWRGGGAVRLLAAEPRLRGLLLERIGPADLTEIAEDAACRVVAGLYGTLHVPALPQLRSLSELVATWTDDLAGLPRGAPIPRRLVEQAVALGRDLSEAADAPNRLLHSDLHYTNVLSAGNGLSARNGLSAQHGTWLTIDPKPVNGDPHYEIAPMLWNRWPEIAGDVRDGVRRRFHTLVDTAGFDEHRARDWVIIRMAHNAMWALRDSPVDRDWLTVCVAVAKAVQD